MTDTAGLSDLIRRLREDLIGRRLDSGMQCLELNRSVIESLEPCQKGAGILIGYLAQWVDTGFEGPHLLQSLLARFPRPSRAALPLIDYLHLRMAEGLIAMTEEDFDRAVGHFAFVESVEEEVRDQEMLAISNFWIARCLRSQGRYDDALSYTQKSREAAQSLGYSKVAAVMQVLESWLAFQKGKLPEAARILQEAEAGLRETDDYVNRGNIQSAYGRIARREARYERALEYFERAMKEYARRNPRHPNIARSLVNMASAERLMRLELRKKMDAAAAGRKTARGWEPAAAAELSETRKRFEQLRESALGRLDAAQAIYERQKNHRGMGAVHMLRGFLCLDSGELDRAESQAGDAFLLGESKSDYILMARARILQCHVENAKFDEQIEEAVGGAHHAQRAHDFAQDAVEFAKHTQNRRLLVRAYVCQGDVFANDFFQNMEAARQCCDAAASLVKPQGPDYIWDDLQELKARILRRGPVETTLREWSQGLVGEKTFQQISEDFAHIIIPKVWEREDRKVSRVAARLSISPKKVRRVLRDAGLLDGADSRSRAAERSEHCDCGEGHDGRRGPAQAE